MDNATFAGSRLTPSLAVVAQEGGSSVTPEAIEFPQVSHCFLYKWWTGGGQIFIKRKGLAVAKL